MSGTNECYDNELDAYGDCATHGYHYELFHCTSADQGACGNSVDGFLGTYESIGVYVNWTGMYVDGTGAVFVSADGGGSTSGLPELTLEGGGLIAGAMLALWALAWTFRTIKKQIEDS